MASTDENVVPGQFEDADELEEIKLEAFSDEEDEIEKIEAKRTDEAGSKSD